MLRLELFPCPAGELLFKGNDVLDFFKKADQNEKALIGKYKVMRMRSRLFAIFVLILAACVPHNTTGAGLAAAKETEAKPAAVGSYLLYLQAKQDQDYDTAVRYLNASLAEDPDNRMLQSEMFTMLTVEGRIDDAYPYAVAELKSAPDSLLASLVVVAYHVKKGNYESALKQIDAFPAKEENAFLYPLLEVWVQAGLKEKKKALSALEKLNQPGTESLYYFHSALLYDMWGDTAEAEKGYETLLSEPGGLSLRAAQAYGNFLLRQGDNKKFAALVDAYRKGAKSYPLIDENFFTAGASKADKKVPRSVATPQAGMAEAFFDISGSLADKGSPETSLFFTRFGLALDPSLSLARVLLGEIYEKQERYQDALDLYREEKENSETYYASQIRIGIIYARQGNLEKAEKQLKKMAEKRPDLAFPWVELGEIFLTNQKFPEAVGAFTEALDRIGPPSRSQWVLYYSRGAAYERNNQWTLAEQDLLQALILAPEQPLTLNYLGYSWMERGKNVQKAKEMLERAFALSPQEGFIADSLGWAYYLMGDYKNAAAVLEIAIALDPGSAVINDHLGDVYWRTGRKREARFQWEKALSVKDDFSGDERERTVRKLEKGLDAVGDKIVLPSRKNEAKKDVKAVKSSEKPAGKKTPAKKAK